MKHLQKVDWFKRIKIDEKDKLILSLLALNCRMPITKISKKIKLSKDAVKYRINILEKKGLIENYITIIDTSKLGFSSYQMFLRLDNLKKESEENIIKKLKSRNYIYSIIKYIGNYDYGIKIIVKDIYDLDEKVTEIITDCSMSVQEYEVLALPKIIVSRTFPKEFLKYPENKKSENKIYKLNKKDMELLKIMSEEAELSLVEIGSRLKTSADSVSYRIKNLLESGYILGFIPSINYAYMGYSLYTVLLNINFMDRENEKKLFSYLKNDKHTLWASKTIGKYNILINFLVKNLDDMEESLNKLRNLFPKMIKNKETMIAFEQSKYVYLPKGLV